MRQAGAKAAGVRVVPGMLGAVLAAVLAAVLVAVGWEAGAAGQEKKPGAGGPPPARQPGKEEVEDPRAGPKGKIPRPDDEEGQPAKPGTAARTGGGLTLDRAIQEAEKQPRIKAFLEGVQLASRITAAGRRHEEEAFARIEAFLRTLPAEGQEGQNLPAWNAAEAALAHVERAYLSARAQDKKYEGPEGEALGEKLRARLLEVRLRQLTGLLESRGWGAVRERARELGEMYRGGPEREAVAGRLVGLAVDWLEQDPRNPDRLLEAYQGLRLIREGFPGTRAPQRLEEKLRARAPALFEETRRQLAGGKLESRAAEQRLQVIQGVRPDQEGLGELLQKLRNELRVGVTELPDGSPPGPWAGDAQRWAAGLTYEGLVRRKRLSGGLSEYVPVLAAEPPEVVGLGRRFRLDPNVRWSNGEPITAADVAATVRAVTDPGQAAYVAGLDRLLSNRVELGGDAYEVTLAMKQGYLDPLSLMTFKVLPRTALAGSGGPGVASGPFVYQGTAAGADGKRQATFAQNPSYGSRPGKARLPAIGKVDFVEYATRDEAVDALVASPEGVQLVPDVPARRLEDLDRAGKKWLGPVRTDRAYFLAVNHRKPPLDNESLRRALALALDREAIVQECFRGKQGTSVHRGLNGLYPPGSWACSPNVPVDLRSPEQAKAALGRAPKVSEPLTLKYPLGDKDLAQAMGLVAAQVKEVLGVEVKPVAVAAGQLREDVRRHDYELAYWWYDFPGETYWVWPLFDPAATGQGGSNYLGYVDSTLVSQVERAMNHRDFEQVRQSTRMIHERLAEKMPLIPLWQLDAFVGKSPRLKAAEVAPGGLFAGVDGWTLDEK